MKLSRSGILLIIGLFICFATITATAHAQEFPPGKNGRPGLAGMLPGIPVPHGLMPYLRLNLSQDQQKELIGILEKYHEMRMPYMDAMMASDQEMAGIAGADILDEESARAILKKQEAVREEMMILELKMAIEMKNVLSSEQLELLRHTGGGRPDRPFSSR